MNKFIILIFLSIILPYIGSTQNPLLVEYDCKTGTLNKPFPFDQSFVVRIKNIKIADECDSLTIAIREVSKLRKLVRDQSKSGCITNEKLFEELKPKYVYTFNPKKDIKAGSLEFLQLGYFSPNTDYVFDISPSGSRVLDQTEQANLTQHLRDSRIFENLVLKIIEDKINNKNDMPSLIKKLNEDPYKAILKYNCSYQFKKYSNEEKDFRVEIPDIFSTIESTLTNFNKALKELYENKNISKQSEWDVLLEANNIIYDEELDSDFDQWKQNGINAKLFTNEDIDKKQIIYQHANFKEGLNKVPELIEKTVLQVVTQRVKNSSQTIGTTYFSGATENASTYLSFDAGYGANMATRDAFPYLGVNIYLRPIKREIPLKHYRGNLCAYFSSHVSFLVGMTTNSIESDPMRGGLIGNKAILLGGGYRILPWLKLNYGSMVYYDMPANPLVNRRYLASDGFISASIDADVVEIFKIFFKKTN